MNTETKVDQRERAIQAYREWLEGYSWDYFCTLKITSGPLNKRRAQEVFRKWMEALESSEGADDFRWFRVMEYGSSRSNPHFHIVIGGLRKRMQNWEQRWRQKWQQKWAELGGEALISPYDPQQKGLLYILKSTGIDGDLDMDFKLPPEGAQEDSPKRERSPTPSPLDGKQEQRRSRWTERKRKTFHICGVGAGPDGTGSGFAWVCVTTAESHVEWRAGLTKEQAEYRSIIAAMRIASLDWDGRCSVVILTDSYSVAHQLCVPFPQLNEAVERLFRKTQDVLIDKEIRLEAKSIPRDENLAAKLLERWVKSGDRKEQIKVRGR
jgi:hypothetical protein